MEATVQGLGMRGFIGGPLVSRVGMFHLHGFLARAAEDQDALDILLDCKYGEAAEKPDEMG